MIKKTINNYSFFLFLYVLFLFLILLPFYRHGQVILGGEGNFYLDFSKHLINYSYLWENNAVGLPSASANSNFPNIYFLTLMQQIVQNVQLANLLLVFLIYFLPFGGMYLLLKKIKIAPYLAFLLSLFYVINPFSSILSANLHHWNLLISFAFPLFFLTIISFYDENWKLFLGIGFVSFFLAFVNVNPPLIVILQIFLFLSTVITAFYLKKKISLFEISKKYLVVLSSFFAFNFWWLLPWIYFLARAEYQYTMGFALSWLRGADLFVPAWWKVTQLRMLFSNPLDPKFDYFSRHYSFFLAYLILYIPITVVIFSLWRKNKIKKHLSLIIFILLIVSFLAKGAHGVFGKLYETMVMQIPFFNIFKTSAEKWGVLFIFFLTLYFALYLLEEKRGLVYRRIIKLFIFYLFYCSIPFLTSNFIPDYKFNDQITGSRKYFDKFEYQELRKKLNDDPEQYRVLSLPGSQNYQVALHLKSDKFYTGIDPVLNNTNKPFLAAYNGNITQRFGVLFDEISHPDYLNLIGFYNIKKIVINKDMYPWFGFQEKESVSEMEEVLDESLEFFKNEAVSLYDVGENFLPRFYTPNQVIYSPESTQYELPELVSLNNVSERTALFISPYEKIKEEDKFENDLVKEKSNQIILVGELQSAIDEAKLRSGVRGMNPGGVLFPYARWKPGSLIYPYILKKEENIKNQFLNQPKELLEQNLFFAGKRVFEIQKWDRKLSDKDFLDVLGRYEKEINEAIENLEKIRQAGEDTFFLLAKIAVSLEAFEERLLGVTEGDFGRNSQRFNLGQETVERTDKTLKSSLKHYFQTRYYFEVPEEGEYEVLLKKEEGIFNWEIKNVTPNKEKEFSLGMVNEQQEKNWLSFGKQKFNAQEYILVLDQTQTQNLLDENWDTSERMLKIGEITKYFNKEGAPTVWQEIENWEPESAYKFSFKYKISSGSLKIFIIEENEIIDTVWLDKGVINKQSDKTNILLEEKLTEKNLSEWQDYSFVIYSGSGVKKAKIFISSESKEGETSEVEVKEATLTKIMEPKMVLKKSKSENSFEVPQITFQKINPTKYSLEIANVNQPYFLVFSESFHRGWKAYLKETTNGESQIANLDGIVGSYFNGEIKERQEEGNWIDKKFYETWGKKSLPEERHLLMNGYANAWYITPEDVNDQESYQIIIEYWPQRLFYLGVGVTLVTIIVSLGFGLWRSHKLCLLRSNKIYLFKHVKKS